MYAYRIYRWLFFLICTCIALSDPDVNKVLKLIFGLVLLAAVLVQGVGLNLGRRACNVAIMSGIILYSGSKILVYLFLGTSLLLIIAHCSMH